MALTTQQIIDIAKASQFLALVDIKRKGLEGGGVDLLLPTKLYNIRKSVEYIYDLDPTEDTLTETGNYLYALCAPYNLRAQFITGISNGSGGVAGISPQSSAPTPYYFIVADDTFIANGESSKVLPATWRNSNMVFSRGGVTQSTVNTESSYFTWDNVTQNFTCVPAATTSELFALIPT